MVEHRTLTLLSDFGLSDSYVGVMKGVIAQVNPSIAVIDLTHQIPPHNIALARFTLMTAYPHFPVGTVHVAVVDPGVGGTRRAIALALGNDATQPTGFLVGPDNGLFSGVLREHAAIAAVELTNPQYWRTPDPSATFHGRDIFAPIGAHLAKGVPLGQIGRRIALETLVSLDVPTWTQHDWHDPAVALMPVPTEVQQHVRLIGSIQAIDRFGNLITTIPGAAVMGRWSVLINETLLPGRQTYSDSPPDELLALIGSHGWIEIAVNGGSAQAKLRFEVGTSVYVVVSR